MPQCDICGYKSSKIGVGTHKYQAHGVSSKEEYECDFCGDMFERHSSRQKSSESNYCSSTCQNEDRKNRNEYECENCGESFEDVVSRREGRKNRDTNKYFCSRECKYDYGASKLSDVPCSYCGEEVTITTHKQRKLSSGEQQNLFCSVECEGEWKSENQVGQNHPHWRGGKEQYYGPNWHKSRREVLDRDDKSCQSCGTTQEQHYDEYGRDLEIHHITPLREFDGDYESANRTENLVTLCRCCHVSVEHSDVDVESLLSA